MNRINGFFWPDGIHIATHAGALGRTAFAKALLVAILALALQSCPSIAWPRR